MFKFLVPFVLLITVSNASAECWIVGNLKGYSASEYNKYSFEKDGITGHSFEIVANKDNSSVKPGELNYSGVSPKSVIGYRKNGDLVTLETWIISSDSRKIFFTQTRSGLGPLDGTKSFIGDVLSRCHN